MAAPIAGEQAGAALSFPVVALVCSAGGLRALTEVLRPLPASLPAAIVIVQHMDPEQPSHMVELLSRCTELPVEVAGNHARLRPASVLVAPPASHLIITSAGTIGLLDTGKLPPARPSADLFLATLAVICEHRVLAVVLTGRGHDAQAGIRAVHHCGGTVLAQDEASSEYFSMPSAAEATGLVHQVLPLAEVAGAIVRHVGLDRAGEPPGWSPRST